LFSYILTDIDSTYGVHVVIKQLKVYKSILFAVFDPDSRSDFFSNASVQKTISLSSALFTKLRKWSEGKKSATCEKKNSFNSFEKGNNH